MLAFICQFLFAGSLGEFLFGNLGRTFKQVMVGDQVAEAVQRDAAFMDNTRFYANLRRAGPSLWSPSRNASLSAANSRMASARLRTRLAMIAARLPPVNLTFLSALTRPMQVAAKKLEGPDLVDGMGAVPPPYGRVLGDAHFGIEPSHPCVLLGNPLVRRHAIVMPPLHHERARRDEHGQFGVVDDVGKVEFIHVIFGQKKVAVWGFDAGGLPDPLIKVRGTNRRLIAVHKGRHADGCLPAVGDAVEGDSPGVNIGLPRKPFQHYFRAAR